MLKKRVMKQRVYDSSLSSQDKSPYQDDSGVQYHLGNKKTDEEKAYLLSKNSFLDDSFINSRKNSNPDVEEIAQLLKEKRHLEKELRMKEEAIQLLKEKQHSKKKPNNELDIVKESSHRSESPEYNKKSAKEIFLEKNDEIHEKDNILPEDLRQPIQEIIQEKDKLIYNSPYKYSLAFEINNISGVQKISSSLYCIYNPVKNLYHKINNKIKEYRHDTLDGSNKSLLIKGILGAAMIAGGLIYYFTNKHNTIDEGNHSVHEEDSNPDPIKSDEFIHHSDI